MKTSLSLFSKYIKNFVLLISLISSSLFAQQKTNPKSQNEELGKVSWYRNYDTAVAEAKKQNKAILILFQEVPGCSTCRNYGHNVLSHPLLVEAIEDQFIPLAIHNNKGGHDGEILKKFKEPSWNNPVVRIVNDSGENLVNRVSGNYSAKGLFKAMETALIKEKKALPEYMKVLGTELSFAKPQTKEKYYSMYCFWTGEKNFGEVEGVLSAEAGFMNHKEVVKVTYDPRIVKENKLDQYAQQNSCKAEGSGNYNFSAKDHLYYLQHSNFKYLPLSELQKTKINSALGKRETATQYLSPKQLMWLKELNGSNSKKVVLYNQELLMAWNSISN